MDLTIARNCIRVMQEDGSYRNHKIGRIKKPVNGLTSIISGIPCYDEGGVVLYRQELSPSDAELQMGEYMGRKQKPTGTVTIEIPLTLKEIEEQRTKGSRLTTIGTMVGVPESYVEEIKI